jgi:hypothetical protein
MVSDVALLTVLEKLDRRGARKAVFGRRRSCVNADKRSFDDSCNGSIRRDLSPTSVGPFSSVIAITANPALPF